MEALTPYWVLYDTTLVHATWGPLYSLDNYFILYQCWGVESQVCFLLFVFSVVFDMSRTAPVLIDCPFPSPMSKRPGCHWNSVSVTTSISLFSTLDCMWYKKKNQRNHHHIFFLCFWQFHTYMNYTRPHSLWYLLFPPNLFYTPSFPMTIPLDKMAPSHLMAINFPGMDGVWWILPLFIATTSLYESWGFPLVYLFSISGVLGLWYILSRDLCLT